MLFSSIVFLFTFLPVTLLVYYLVPGRLKNIVLLLASLVFYAWGEPVYVILMVLSILFNYVSGIDIERNLENPFKAKQSLVIAGVIQRKVQFQVKLRALYGILFLGKKL